MKIKNIFIIVSLTSLFLQFVIAKEKKSDFSLNWGSEQKSYTSKKSGRKRSANKNRSGSSSARKFGGYKRPTGFVYANIASLTVFTYPIYLDGGISVQGGYHRMFTPNFGLNIGIGIGGKKTYDVRQISSTNGFSYEDPNVDGETKRSMTYKLGVTFAPARFVGFTVSGGMSTGVQGFIVSVGTIVKIWKLGAILEFDFPVSVSRTGDVFKDEFKFGLGVPYTF
jgi:hypothetical protein